MIFKLLFFLVVSHNVVGKDVFRMQQSKDEIFNHITSKRSNVDGFAFASYYNDNMVLQQAPQQAVVWGTYPDVGTRIIVKVKEVEKTYAADVVPSSKPGVGVWSVTLDAFNAGGPYTIVALAEAASISLNKVLFGDVWVCSGQSNMQFSTDMIFNASEELANAHNYKDIRLFTASMEYSSEPLMDLAGIAEQWSLPNETTVGHGAFSYMSAVCWLYGRRLYEELKYPIGLIDTTWGGTPVEAWSSPDALAQAAAECGDSSITNNENQLHDQNSNSQLWNAMVYPLLNMTIYGTIWYQGEADAREPKMSRYNCTFPSMIDDWRLKFSQSSQQTRPDFPFGFVQLAGDNPDPSTMTGFPDIRWHQTADYGYVPNQRMQNVFMSVAMDLPDFVSPYGSVHPRDKQDVASRLFLSGLQVAYKKGSTDIQGPIPYNVVQSGIRLAINFTQPGGKNFSVRVQNHAGFELCCNYKGTQDCLSNTSWWVPTSVVSVMESIVFVEATVCGEKERITGLRYAWRESPCAFKQCAIYSVSNGLPAPPFVLFNSNADREDFSFTVDHSVPTRIQN